MNIKRGLIRLWVLFSVLWVLGVLGLTGQDWYHAASYWYRSRGFDAAQCDVQQTEELRASLLRTKAAPVGQSAPPGAPPTRKPNAEEFLGDVGRPVSSSGETNPFAKFLPANEQHGAPWEKYQTAPPWDCYRVTVPDGSRYVVAVNRNEKSTWNAAKIKNLAVHNPNLFWIPPEVRRSGDAAEPTLVDLTDAGFRSMLTLDINGKRVKVDDSFLKLSPEQKNATVDEIAKSLGGGTSAPHSPLPGSGGYFIVGPEWEHPDLAFAEFLAILGLAVSVAVFILGSGIWWAAAGFRP